MLNNPPFEQKIMASFGPPCRHSGGGSQLAHPPAASPVPRTMAWPSPIPEDRSHIPSKV